MEIMWRSCGDGAETHSDGVGADLMAKASRGRVGTYVVDNRDPRDAER